MLSFFLMQLVSCILLTGLIWVIQVVHYPLFCLVGSKEFKKYEKEHQKRISYIVGPLFLIEAFSAVVLLFFFNRLGPFKYFYLVSFVLLIGIWLSTFYLQVPLHMQLMRGKNKTLVQKLVKTNWLRTAGWSLRSSILLLLLVGQVA